MSGSPYSHISGNDISLYPPKPPKNPKKKPKKLTNNVDLMSPNSRFVTQRDKKITLEPLNNDVKAIVDEMNESSFETNSNFKNLIEQIVTKSHKNDLEQNLVKVTQHLKNENMDEFHSIIEEFNREVSNLENEEYRLDDIEKNFQSILKKEGHSLDELVNLIVEKKDISDPAVQEILKKISTLDLEDGMVYKEQEPKYNYKCIILLGVTVLVIIGLSLGLTLNNQKESSQTDNNNSNNEN